MDYIISKKDFNLDETGNLTIDQLERYNAFKISGQNIGISIESVNNTFRLLLNENSLMWINPTTFFLAIIYSDRMLEYKRRTIDYENIKLDYSMNILNILKKEAETKNYYVPQPNTFDTIKNDIIRYALYYKTISQIDF